MARFEDTKWLIIGGAGYIGAHVVRDMVAAGATCIVVDDMSTGIMRRLPTSVQVYKYNAANVVQMHKVIVENKIDGIMHFAAKKDARESVELPVEYWHHNMSALTGPLFSHHGCKWFIFSSSSSVYGLFCDDETAETHPQTRPLSPYGFTKLAGEQLVEQAGRAHGFKTVSLRYFNVVGAGDFDYSLDVNGNGIVTTFVNKMAEDVPVVINGNTYNTIDGTPVRDYIDVRDVSRAHVQTAYALVKSHLLPTHIDLGTGKPMSALQIASRIATIMNKAVDHDLIFHDLIRFGAAVPGDPAKVCMPVNCQLHQVSIASIRWQPKFTIEESLQSHIDAHQRLHNEDRR